MLLGIFNRSNFKYSTFSDLKVDRSEENKKKVDNTEENKTRKKSLSISNHHVSTISWSCFKSVKSKVIYFWQGHADQHLKIIFVIAHLENIFTIEAQQILDLLIRKRKLRKRWKNRHRAQRKLHKSWKKRHCAQRKLRIWATCVLANYCAQHPPLVILCLLCHDDPTICHTLMSYYAY